MKEDGVRIGGMRVTLMVIILGINLNVIVILLFTILAESGVSSRTECGSASGNRDAHEPYALTLTRRSSTDHICKRG